MSLESSTTIAGLVASNPPDGDPFGQGAAHLRLIKTVLQDDAVSLSAAGTQTLAGSLTVNGGLIVASGQTFNCANSFDGNTSGFNCVVPAAFSGTLSVGGALTVGGTTTHTGAVTVNANLGVNGTTYLDATNVAGALGVTGTASVSSTLYVGGVATFGSNVVVDGTFTSQGATVDNGGLTVNGASSFTSGVSFSGGTCSFANAINSVGYECRSGVSGSYGANAFNIYWSGGVAYLYIDGSNVGGLSVTSDARIKANVQGLPGGALASVQKLYPVSYTVADTGPFKAAPTPRAGFVADAVKLVLPAAVHGSPTADTKADPQYLSLDPLALIALLTKAVQELATSVTALQGEVAALKAPSGH